MAVNGLNSLSFALAPQPPEHGDQGGGAPPHARASCAWLREMERAQLASWFRSAPAAPQAAAMPRTGIDRAPTAMLSPAAIGLGCTAYSAGGQAAQPGRGGSHVGTHQLEMAAATSMARHQAYASPACASMVEVRALLARTALSALPSATAASTTDLTLRGGPLSGPAGMRIHVEPRADGVAVWIGANPDDPIIRQHLPLLLDALQRSLLDRGLRLSALTLNGRTVWQPSMPSDPHPPKETPWPSAQ